MTTRREFIQAGAALSAAVAPGASALASAAAPSKVLALHKIAFDGRSSAGLAFAAEARRLGAQVHDIGGDVTGLYASELLETWRRSPAPVAGLTTYNALFALQMMATGADLRLVWRVNHQRRSDGSFGHAVFGPDRVRAGAGEIGGSETAWASKAAQIVARWPAADLTIDRARSNIADADLGGVPVDTLVSWVLAPVRRT